eukprot:XP_001697396.1 predicted protein [Chlamydomonas reinhardtii]
MGAERVGRQPWQWPKPTHIAASSAAGCYGDCCCCCGGGGGCYGGGGGGGRRLAAQRRGYRMLSPGCPGDALGWARAHVVGHSMGAMIGCRLALTAPERLASLTLVSATGGGSEAIPTNCTAIAAGVTDELLATLEAVRRGATHADAVHPCPDPAAYERSACAAALCCCFA